jgi:Flp pilus assembly protein TadB
MNDPQEERKRRSAFLSVLLALLATLACVVFLVLLTGGLFLYVVFAAAGMLGFAGLHYLMWGRALSQALSREMEEERLLQRAREEAPQPPPSTAFRQR